VYKKITLPNALKNGNSKHYVVYFYC